MIETLTKKKLKQYGFDRQAILHLTTLNDYECITVNNMGYFFASNKENKIYSGIEGKNKYFEKSKFPEYEGEPKEKFKTFEDFFRYAVNVGSIIITGNKNDFQYDYSIAESIHNFRFNDFLVSKGWEFANEKAYTENLTRENWVEYLTHCESENKKQKEKGEKTKISWKPKSFTPQQTETKTDKLKIELGKYGFFELSKVKQLSETNKQRLAELISTNALPYSIAMFEYLGFLKYLKAEHFTSDYKLFKAVANWFEVTERAVKGNIYVLNKFSKENRTRYTADQQKQTVQKNYEVLK